MASYKDAAHLVRTLQPIDPVFCTRPHAAEAAARAFLREFPGETFYAVKANPADWLLKTLRRAGVHRFEVASIVEARSVRSLFPDAEIAFMHPVKAEEAVREAYDALGIRVFALDTVEELEKILRATHGADDLTLCLRHRVKNRDAKITLSEKFGAEGDAAATLLQRMRQVSDRLAVGFHVGSQAMAPSAYVDAIETVEQTIVRAGVIVDVIDVGGGFPVSYPGMSPPPIADYFDAIERRFEQMLVAENCALWCEPGRALSAEAASLIVRVEGRKGNDLYINDGAYGALFDAAHLNWPYFMRQISPERAPSAESAFRLFGPTCDDLDLIEGPYWLPSNIGVGDYLEIDGLGAYGAVMATRFNGFGGAYRSMEIADEATVSALNENKTGNNALTIGTLGARHGI